MGLLEGSPASNALLNALLQGVTDCAPEGSAILVYADNFLAACEDESVRGQLRESMASCLAGHPAGQFSLRVEEHYAPDGFEWLGYCLMEGIPGQVAVSPSAVNLHKLQAKIEKLTPDECRKIRRDPASATKTGKMLLAPFSAVSDAFRWEVEDNIIAQALRNAPSAIWQRWWEHIRAVCIGGQPERYYGHP